MRRRQSRGVIYVKNNCFFFFLISKFLSKRRVNQSADIFVIRTDPTIKMGPLGAHNLITPVWIWSSELCVSMVKTFAAVLYVEIFIKTSQ